MKIVPDSATHDDIEVDFLVLFYPIIYLGENVAAGAAVITTYSLAAKRWQAEEKWWDHDKMEAVDSPRKRNSDCFHFTQNMWKSTRQVCFAKSRSKSNIVYITARFWPRGNIAHQWRENLLPPLE